MKILRTSLWQRAQIFRGFRPSNNSSVVAASVVAPSVVAPSSPGRVGALSKGTSGQYCAPRRILIAGKRETACRLASEFQRHFPHSYSVIGLLANEWSLEERASGSQSALVAQGDASDKVGVSRHELPVIGRIQDLAEVSCLHKVDQVLIADYFAPEFKALEGYLQPWLAEREVCSGSQLVTGKSLSRGSCEAASDEKKTPDGQALKGHNCGYFAVKRAADIVFSLLGLIAVLPILVVLGLLNKWTAPGPVLFSQERVGLNGRRFQIYKLRTMRIDAEAQTGPVLAQHRDSRCTPLGAFLRATKIDELPQLYNVLRGDMSLIGPRPERTVFVEMYERCTPHYVGRHQVRPGLTGLAQVNGDQLTHVNVKLHYDLMYVENCSIGLDSLLLVCTPLFILKTILAKPERSLEQSVGVQNLSHSVA